MLSVLVWFLIGVAVITGLLACLPILRALIGMAPFDSRKVTNQSMMLFVAMVFLIMAAVAVQAQTIPQFSIRGTLTFVGMFALVYIVMRSTSRRVSELFDKREKRLSKHDRPTANGEPESENESSRSLL